MGLKLIFVLMFVVGVLVEFGLSLSVEEQKEFDLALQKHIKNLQNNNNHLQEKVINNRARNNQFRRSSGKGKLLHEIASFSREFLKKREKRAANPLDHNNGHPGLLINSSYCPFKATINCDSSSKYRLVI